MRAARLLLIVLGSLLASASSAAACLTVGVYQPNPAASLPALERSVGPGISVISAYVTAGHPLPKSLVTLANRQHARLLVTWNPDGGSDGATQAHYRVADVVHGRYDASLRALAAQLRGVRLGAVLRPMPEMNTPWYAWSGTVNGNSPAAYVAAWRRVRRIVQSAPSGHAIQFLWAPYAQSIPDTSANQFSAYFPGASEVDLVGASGYNFGAQAPLTWANPGDIFSSAYGAIEALAPKPFWVAETGSTSVGGDAAGWILSLETLQSTGMSNLAGVVWFDARDTLGDFRIQGKPVTDAFHALLQGACR